MIAIFIRRWRQFAGSKNRTGLSPTASRLVFGGRLIRHRFSLDSRQRHEFGLLKLHCNPLIDSQLSTWMTRESLNSDHRENLSVLSPHSRRIPLVPERPVMRAFW